MLLTNKRDVIFNSQNQAGVLDYAGEVLATKDPLLLSRAFSGQYFQGEPIPNTLYSRAMQLAACDISGGCDRPDADVVWQCAAHGVCESSVESLSIRLNRQVGFTDADIDRVMSVRRAMVAAIQSGDGAAFVASPKK